MECRHGSVRERHFPLEPYLWAIGIALCVITLLGCGATIWDLHRQTIEQNRISVTNLSVVLAEQTSRYVQVVDLALAEVQSRVATLGINTPDDLVTSAGTEATRDFLRGRLKNLPQANSFSLFKPDGQMFLTTRSQWPPDLNMSDLDYHRYLVAHDDPGPFISAPVQSRVTGTPTVYIARGSTVRATTSLVSPSVQSICNISRTSTRPSHCRPARP